MAQQLYHQPGAVAAGAGGLGQGFVRRLDAGLHADGVGDHLRQGGIDVEDEIGGLLFRAADLGQIGVELFAQRLDLQIGRQLGLQVLGIGEGIFFRVRLTVEQEGWIGGVGYGGGGGGGGGGGMTLTLAQPDSSNGPSYNSFGQSYGGDYQSANQVNAWRTKAFTPNPAASTK
jgi:hypothetical protein